MTQEEKELLLKDLCARLPYGVMIQYAHFAPIRFRAINNICLNDTYVIENCKPYLRPMSSMNEEEEEEYDTFKFLANTGDKYLPYETSCFADWLNAHHFDYRGLIEKGLALEAPEDMYERR